MPTKPSTKPIAKSGGSLPASKTTGTPASPITSLIGSAPKLTPADWLRSVTFPLTDEKLETLAFEYPFEVLQAILESANAVKDAEFGIISKSYSGPAFLDWVCKLSNEVILEFSKHGYKDYKDRLYVSLEAIYAEDILTVDMGKSSMRTLNQIHFAAFFTFSNRIEYDDSIGCYFQYIPQSGRWHEISECEVREQLTRFIVPYMANNPSVYTGTDRVLKEILAQTKAIGRHHNFEIPNGKIILVKNGTVLIDNELGTISFGGHSPIYKLRNQIPLEYDSSKVGYTSFRKFLTEMFPSPSSYDIELLQYWTGMVLLGRNDLHKILVLTGPAGSGKSTLLNLVEKAVGIENVGTLATQRLEDRFELSEFFGKTLLIGKDVSADALNNRASHMLKSLSGDSGIKAEVKHIQRRVRLGGPFHICLMSNSKLNVRIQSDADAWKRRLWVIETTAPPSTRNTKRDYETELIRTEGSGILNWMLNGAKLVLKSKRLDRKFVLSTDQKGRIDALITGNNSIELFVRAKIAKSSGSSVTSSDLYMAYYDFCAKNDLDGVNQATFSRRIGSAICKHHTTTHKNVSNGRSSPVKGYIDIKIQ